MPILCDTQDLVDDAVNDLSAADYIILDCEGQQLGMVDGELSLIQLGTPNAQRVYLIDAVVLDRSSLQPVLDLLADEGKRKVVWDGRQDYSELYHGLGTPICNVLDLQIVDVMSRTIRGEIEQRRIWRLGSRALSNRAVAAMQCEGVHAVNGLGKALQEHGVTGVSGKDTTVSSMHSAGQSITWMYRPLPSTLISYASHDLQMIASLYNHFNNRGYLSDLPTLLEQSKRFVSIHRDRGRPTRNNIYRSSNLLPLGILHPIEGPTKLCDKCNRPLSSEHFPTVGKGLQSGRRATCKVCQILTVRKANGY
ncbi:hypothetical protein BD410DRAFT_730761 [Rickenella mellea]|uniref:3'-5' exonuclease domain-containing protein n=1 Tax=Rickenella mellea TaxID=50990 RepID=A0A4Y7PN66_9AGAM|nr:hypothetical protein BD410DRAFT_730761 [Rickenella mellea]